MVPVQKKSGNAPGSPEILLQDLGDQPVGGVLPVFSR